MAKQNYTLGRGEIYFAKFATGTLVPDGERYFGNTPEFSLSVESETLDHFSSDRGIRELDSSVLLQTNRQGSFTTDSIHPENLALFFFGVSDTLTSAAATGVVENHTMKKDYTYQLGTSAARPTGARKVTNVVVKKGAAVLVAGTDYELDADLGRVKALDTSAAIDGLSVINVTYDITASTRDRIVSGSSAIEGALRYVAYNPDGANFDYYMPHVKISPRGDFQLKAQEWQIIPFSLSVLKRTDREAIYIDSRPFAV